MRELVDYLVKELVAHPDAVQVSEAQGPEGTVYEVSVHSSDVGRVIGKGGKVANSLRTLVKAAASKEYGRASVEIIAD